MSLLDALILAVIQGITEFLPISSKSHMALYQLWLGGREPDVAYEFSLHIGTIAATLVYFRKELPPTLRDRKLLAQLALTTLCLGLGFPFRHVAERLLGSEVAIAIGFLVLAGLLFATERLPGRLDVPGWGQALAVGIGQSFAVWPGISRSGATSFSALASGLKPAPAFRYIFLCSIPALTLASSYELRQGLKHGDPRALTVSIPVLLTGIVVSGVIGYFALKLLDRVFIRRRLALFGVYVGALALTILLRRAF